MRAIPDATPTGALPTSRCPPVSSILNPMALPRASSQCQRIGELLRLDLIDDLRLAVVPVLVGGGLRLFPDGVSARFATAGVTTLAHGAIGLHLRRP